MRAGRPRSRGAPPPIAPATQGGMRRVAGPQPVPMRQRRHAWWPFVVLRVPSWITLFTPSHAARNRVVSAKPGPRPLRRGGSFERETGLFYNKLQFPGAGKRLVTWLHSIFYEHGCTGCTGLTGREAVAREADWLRFPSPEPKGRSLRVGQEHCLSSCVFVDNSFFLLFQPRRFRTASTRRRPGPLRSGPGTRA